MTEENTYWRDYSKTLKNRKAAKRYGTCVICRLAGQAEMRKQNLDKKLMRVGIISRPEYTDCPKCSSGGIPIVDEEGDLRCICGWQPTAKIELPNG
jgi:hypothetical protein